jgi:ferredoxin-type protein NapH
MASVKSMATAARSRLQAADLRLRKAPVWQWVRRAVLTISCALVVGLPLLFFQSANAASAGLASNRWARVAALLPFSPADPPLVGAPWTVSLFGLEVLDPLAFASLAAAGHLSWHLVVGVLPALLLVVLFGRFFCGWLCPYIPILAASNLVRALLPRFGLSARDVPLPRNTNKVILAGGLLATAIGGTHLIPLVYPPSIIARAAFRAIFFGGLGFGAAFILAAFLFDSLVSRSGFCRYLCPGGALFSLLGARTPLQVTRTPSLCTDCTACDVVCNLMQQPMTDQLDMGCEKCGKCVSVCPTEALAFTMLRPPKERA